jgi:hypothetical protein
MQVTSLAKGRNKMQTPEGREKSRVEYEAMQAKLSAVMDACRYCKVARKRGKRGCKKHLERSRLNYVTSPISEAYWSS